MKIALGRSVPDGHTRWGEMTYKLESGLSRITSPVRLIFPEGSEEYENGKEAADDLFDKKWRVVELRARENVVEIRLIEMDVPMVNPIGEETFF